MKARMKAKGRFIVLGMVVEMSGRAELLVLTGKDCRNASSEKAFRQSDPWS